MRPERGLGVHVDFECEAGEGRLDDPPADGGVKKDYGLGAVQIFAKDSDRDFGAGSPTLRVDGGEGGHACLDFVRRLVDGGQRGG